MLDPAQCEVIIPAAGCSRRLRNLTRDRPKSLLEIDGTPIIEHSLDVLARQGFLEITLIVGYQRERLMGALGDRRADQRLEYVVCEEYDRTEHGWSLYLARHAWRRRCAPVIFMDADNLYHPCLLAQLARSPREDVCLADAEVENFDRDEELIRGEAGRIHGLVRGRRPDYDDWVGAFVGINRFSASFMGSLFDFMDGFFESNGAGYKYERVFDAFVRATGTPLYYELTGSLPWINVNYEDDLAQALRVARLMSASDHDAER